MIQCWDTPEPVKITLLFYLCAAVMVLKGTDVLMILLLT